MVSTWHSLLAYREYFVRDVRVVVVVVVVVAEPGN